MDLKTYSTLKFVLIVALVSHLMLVLAVVFEWFGPPSDIGGRFCEAARDGLIKQPANTISNLAFAIAGIISAWQVDRKRFSSNINAITRTNFFPKFLSSAMVLLSAGSMAMHATETFMGGYFDMMSMYLIASIVFCYAMDRFFQLRIHQFILLFMGVLAVCHYFLFFLRHIEFPLVRFSGNFIFLIFVIGAVITELVHHKKNRTEVELKWAYAIIFTGVTAFLIWLTGTDDHPWCRPYSYLQAHAIWHILNGLVLYFVFRYYVSENEGRTMVLT